MFSANESTADRVIRAIVGVALLAAAWFIPAGPVRIVFLVVGVIALFTAATGLCLIYRIFGISTKRA